MKFAATIALLSLALLVTSCGSDPTAPLRMTGRLSGTAGMFDTNNALIADASGIVVAATVGTTGTPIITTTASDGSWHFENLPAGIYVITFSKPGFVTQTFPGYQFVGGGEAYLGVVNLVSLSSIRVTSFSIRIGSAYARTDSVGKDSVELGGPAIIITATFSGQPNGVGIFFNTTPTIAPEVGNYNGVGLFSWVQNLRARDMAIIPLTYLRDAGYRSGDLVYASLNTLSGTTYRDPAAGKELFPGAVPANSSAVVSFTMP